jgi:Xaa-Pro aminopeptidase
MKAGGIDALIVTGRENINYFMGFSTGLYNIDDKYFNCFGILPADMSLKPTFVVREGNEGTASLGWVEDKRFWACTRGEYGGVAHADTILEVLREKGLNRARIGLEYGASMDLKHEIYKDLEHKLSGTLLLDGSPVIWGCRKVKSDREIEIIRKACDITCQAYMKGFEEIKEGVSEIHIAKAISAIMTEEGADLFGPGVIMMYSGRERETWCDALPSDYVLKKGDLLQIDGGCTFGGYKSDIMRMACVGRPTREQADNYEIAREAYHSGLEAVKEGVRCSDVWRAGMKIWLKHGLRDFVENRKKANWCIDGHSIGLDIHEPPNIGLADDGELKENMVITLEFFNTHNGTWPLKDAQWWYVMENIIRVKKDGCEVLSSRMPDDLWIA